ncbi:hypothetical protein [Jiulongibacter sp. NS-SX5]|uniref:hypothetical protein n=1 Tax=Jiulongibacter sp. NS-SX5 TaxID=3463854 RepID=UPI0040595A5D
MIKSILSFPVQVINKITGAFSNIIKATKKPLRADVLSINSLVIGFLVASAVFVLFTFLGPYGINQNSASNKTLLVALASLSGLVGYLVADFLLPVVFKKFFDNSHWTVMRQFFLYVLRFFFVGLFVMVFSNQVGLSKFDLPLVLLQFTAIGAVIGFILAFIQESVLSKKFVSKAEDYSSFLKNYTPAESQKMIFPVIGFSGSNDKINIVPNQLISIKINKYDSQFVYQNFFGLVDKKLDIQAEEVEKELGKHPQFFKVSSSEYVNAHAMYKVSGDASGLQIHVAKREEAIRLDKKFEKALNNL